MSYIPSQNEVSITGVDISSGGTDWFGLDVVIPLSSPDGSPLTPSQFYVKSATDGSLIKVDPATAAQLYATSVAINCLNFLNGPGQAYSYPTDWQQVVSQVQTDLAGENLLNLAEGFAPILAPALVGLFVPGLDVFDAVAAADLIQGVISTFLQVGATNYTNNVEFASAYSYLQDASTLLTNSESTYDKSISYYMTLPGAGSINYKTVYETYNNTVLSIDVGDAAITEIKTLVPSLSDDLFNLVQSTHE